MLRKVNKEKTYNTKTVVHDENQYIMLIEDIINHGHMMQGRNGYTKTLCGSAMHFSLENGTLPLLTTKKVAWKTCLKELLWFISGSTSNKILQQQNVKIWDSNASREFLDSRGLHQREENDLGPVYGHQWRHFNAEYGNCDDKYVGKGHDQLQSIIDTLKDPEMRYSRRMVMSSWNPCQLDEMALPPCHVLVQFNVLPPNKLSCSLYQRSGDIGLGVPFNIASYCMLTHLIAHHCELEAYEFCYHLGNCHIYDDHLTILSEQTMRVPYSFPKISFKKKYQDIEAYQVDDFQITDYNFHPQLKMVMRT